jgi:hypothetical protein
MVNIDQLGKVTARSPQEPVNDPKTDRGQIQNRPLRFQTRPLGVETGQYLAFRNIGRASRFWGRGRRLSRTYLNSRPQRATRRRGRLFLQHKHPLFQDEPKRTRRRRHGP